MEMLLTSAEVTWPFCADNFYCETIRFSHFAYLPLPFSVLSSKWPSSDLEVTQNRKSSSPFSFDLGLYLNTKSSFHRRGYKLSVIGREGRCPCVHLRDGI